MNRQRSALVLVVIPAIVSLAVTLLTLTFLDRQRPQQRVIMLPTHSATSMIEPRATFPPAPSDVPDSASEAGEEAAALLTDEPVESGCENPSHTVEGGQVLGAIAEQYQVSVDEIIQLNALIDPAFDPDFLSVGQTLIIPVCGIPTPTPTAPPPDTAVPTRNVPAPIATATNPPPGAVRVVISRIVNPGDITREAVEIVNQGSPVDLEGWTITGSEGREEFEFPAFRLFSGGGVTIYTGVGENTPIDLYWGLDRAVWEVGETVSLFDADGDLQFELTIEAE